MVIELAKWVVPTIATITYILCYILKLWLTNKEKQTKVIPTFAALIGVILAFVFRGNVENEFIETLLIGLVSGLSATGINQAVHLFEKK